MLDRRASEPGRQINKNYPIRRTGRKKLKTTFLVTYGTISKVLSHIIHLDSQKRENGEENHTGRILEDTSKTRNGK